MSVTSLTLSFLTGKMSLSAAVRMKENTAWKVLWDMLGAGPHAERGPYRWCSIIVTVSRSSYT